jgi:two-component system nitrate/nitrite response regulator NarL
LRHPLRGVWGEVLAGSGPSDYLYCMPVIRVLIVADDPLARAGLAMLLSDQPDCEVVGQVAAESASKDILDTFPADVILWDLGWDSALELGRLPAPPADGLPVVTLLSDPVHALEVWAAGAQGILPRDATSNSLRSALIAAAQGLVVIDPQTAASLLPSAEHTPAQPLGELTPREVEVLQLLSEGLPNKAIASQLSISEHTVKFHVNAIMGKLGAQSRTDAVMRATRSGLIIL